MARTPLDEHSQRELLDLLRVDIERAMNGNSGAARRVDALVARNPHSWRSTYVTYNLGKRKFRWLWSRVAAGATGALPPRYDDASRPSLGDPVRE